MAWKHRNCLGPDLQDRYFRQISKYLSGRRRWHLQPPKKGQEGEAIRQRKGRSPFAPQGAFAAGDDLSHVNLSDLLYDDDDYVYILLPPAAPPNEFYRHPD